MSVLRVGLTIGTILLLACAVALYVERRARWALGYPRTVSRLLGAVFVLAIVSLALGRTLGHEHVGLAVPLGTFGGAVVLGVLISSALLFAVDVARWMGRRFAALGRLGVTAGAAAPASPKATSSDAAARDLPAQPERRVFLSRAAVTGAISLGMGSAFYGTLFGRREYTVETVPIRLAKLPRALDGLTIVQLSDLHVGTYVGDRELGAALDLVQKARADLVVLTGDLLDHDLHYAPTLARFARALESRTRYGVFAIPGNHDYYAGAPTVLARLREAGTHVLLNEHVRIGQGDAALVLAGLDDVAGPDFFGPGPRLGRALAGAPDTLPRVILSHNPTTFARVHPYADLTLSGHTHGGQITLFVNPAELVLRHGLVRGHYVFDESQLYVNRGFGTAGPPARIGSPPEITRLVLTSA